MNFEIQFKKFSTGDWERSAANDDAEFPTREAAESYIKRMGYYSWERYRIWPLKPTQRPQTPLTSADYSRIQQMIDATIQHLCDGSEKDTAKSIATMDDLDRAITDVKEEINNDVFNNYARRN